MKKPEEQSKVNLFFVKYLTPIPFLQKTIFIENLRVLIQAGISVVEALRILEKQSSNAKMKMIVSGIAVSVEKGTQLSDALSEYPDFFPEIYVRMMAAGEASGKLEQSLTQIEEQMRRTHELRSKIRGAMIYPAILIIALIGIGTEMMVFVLPKLLSIFKEVDAELPLPTRILIASSDFLVAYGLWVFFGIIAAVFIAGVEYKREGVKMVVHKILLKIPIIGTIIKKINLARFSTTLHTLLSSGIPIIDALKITADVIPSRPYKQVVENCVEKVKLGTEVAPLLEEKPNLFPPMVTQMIAVGERSGNTESMLAELAKFLNAEVEEMLKNFTTVIEPVIILFLGVVVAGMAVAVIMPMYSLAQNI